MGYAMKVTVAMGLVYAAAQGWGQAGAAMRFDCGLPGKAAKGATSLTEKSVYAGTGTGAYGFDLKMAPASFAGGACASDKPFFFSVGAGDGDYKVTVVLGGPKASTTTLRRSRGGCW